MEAEQPAAQRLESVTMNPERAESEDRSILDRLGIAEDPLVGADPVSFLRSLAAASVALVKNPAGVAAANARMALGSAAAFRAAAERSIGVEAPGPVSPATGDKRFADRAFAENPLYFLFAQQYLLNGQLARAAGCGRSPGLTGHQGAFRCQIHPRRDLANEHTPRQSGCGAGGV